MRLDFTEPQRRLAESGVLSGVAEAQRRFAESGALSGVAEAQRRFAESGALSGVAEAQRRFAESGALSGVAEAQRRFAESGALSGVAEAQRRFAEIGALSGIAEAQRSLGTSSNLERLNRLVDEDHVRWSQIERSFDTHNEDRVERLVAPIRTHNIAAHFERAISARSEQDREATNTQFQLLGAIAEAGKKQNETVAEIARLQGTLVREALANTRIQQIVLYLAALSAALGLASLIFR